MSKYSTSYAQDEAREESEQRADGKATVGTVFYSRPPHLYFVRRGEMEGHNMLD